MQRPRLLPSRLATCSTFVPTSASSSPKPAGNRHLSLELDMVYLPPVRGSFHSLSNFLQPSSHIVLCFNPNWGLFPPSDYSCNKVKWFKPLPSWLVVSVLPPDAACGLSVALTSFSIFPRYFFCFVVPTTRPRREHERALAPLGFRTIIPRRWRCQNIILVHSQLRFF